MDIDILLYDLKRQWLARSSLDNMFNLMSNCCSWVTKVQQPVRKVTVLVVGLDNAGKTSTIRGILKVFPGEVSPTQGCVRTELRVDSFLVTLLDVSGAPQSLGAWKEHYGEAHGIILVVDSSDRPRIREVREVLVDLLKQPRVAGKPLLVLANKQDKMGALLGSELIEALTLEKLVNQSRSLCHIEPSSALLDVRRWSDRKTLRGLRWLLHAVSLDYPELCARVARDQRLPLGPEDRDRRGRHEKEKGRSKSKEERIRTSKTDLGQTHQPPKGSVPQAGGNLEPIRDILKKETTFKRKMKKKKQVKIKDAMKNSSGSREEEGGRREEEEEQEGTESQQDLSGQKEEKASTALLPRNRGRLNRKAKVKEETLELPDSPNNQKSKTKKGKGEKKKRKTVKVKRKNKINTEDIPAGYSQPVDLSATFDLYRKAILALKARQDQSQ